MATKHDYHWTFGTKAHIEFPGGGDPVDAGLQSFITEEGCATASDPATGALLFYTDGRTLYDKLGNPLTPPNATLGGNLLSAHSAIIVPPAGGGSRYHIFGVDQWDNFNVGKAVVYTAVTVTGGNANPPVSGPQPLVLIGPPTGATHQGAAERLAAISHERCDRYWVIAQSVEGGHGKLYAILVDSDAMPSTQVLTPYPFSPSRHQNCVKFSPDGTLFAVANERVGNGATTPGRIDILGFSRATGAFTGHSQITGFPANSRPYGVEFSPSSQYLFFTDHKTGKVYRHKIGASALLSNVPVVSQWPAGPAPSLGALQLGPNGKIYGAKSGTQNLLEIGDPDHPAAVPTPADVQFKAVALTGNTNPLSLSGSTQWGLPTFTRIADSCRKDPGAGDRCAELAAEVDALLAAHELHNALPTCKGETPPPPRCETLDIPPLEPQVYIRWGDSKCDCIEGDDTEVMHLIVCNPYKNLTLSNLTVQQLVVVDANGNPVPVLPSGDPSIELVPIGPYCFDDIAPCTCVAREFVLWLRGAPGGPYQIRVKGICFDACFHGDTGACFQFVVCKD